MGKQKQTNKQKKWEKVTIYKSENPNHKNKARVTKTTVTATAYSLLMQTQDSFKVQNEQEESVTHW